MIMKSGQAPARAEIFFTGKPIEFGSEKSERDRDLSVKIIMESLQMHLEDYYHAYEIKVDYRAGGLNSTAHFYYNFSGFSHTGDISLFKGLAEKARRIHAVMACESATPDLDLLTECLFEIKKQAEEEFLQPE